MISKGEKEKLILIFFLTHLVLFFVFVVSYMLNIIPLYLNVLNAMFLVDAAYSIFSSTDSYFECYFNMFICTCYFILRCTIFHCTQPDILAIQMCSFCHTNKTH